MLCYAMLCYAMLYHTIRYDTIRCDTILPCRIVNGRTAAIASVCRLRRVFDDDLDLVFDADLSSPATRRTCI